MILTLEAMVRSATTSEANATDPETLRDIVDSFLAGERNGTGGLYVRDSTFVRAIAALVAVDPRNPDSRDGGACLAEARGHRSEQRRAAPHSVGRPRPAGHL